MKRKTILIITGIVLVLALLITIVLKFGGSFINTNSKTLELTYTTNGGVPYTWEFEIEDESIVKFVKSYVIEDKNKDGLVGAPISTNYVFEGLKEGKTSITFKYVSLAGEGVVKEEKTNILVDKDKNISIYVFALPKNNK